MMEDAPRAQSLDTSNITKTIANINQYINTIRNSSTTPVGRRPATAANNNHLQDYNI